MLAGAVGHLDGDLVAGLRQRDFLMVHFHRGDLLGEIGRMAVKPDAIADRQRALGHTHDGDARSLEVVDHGPDQLFGHRPSSRASPTTIWCRLRGRYLIATCATHRAGSTTRCGNRLHHNLWRQWLSPVVAHSGGTGGLGDDRAEPLAPQVMVEPVAASCGRSRPVGRAGGDQVAAPEPAPYCGRRGTRGGPMPEQLVGTVVHYYFKGPSVA